MFQELMPLLARRMLILTLSRVSDETLCVNVIPKPLKSEQQNDDAALTTPLAVTGTPQELDEQLPKHLAEFVETHLGLSSTLESAKERMDAAAKAAREAAKKATNSRSHSGSSRGTTTNSTQVQIDTAPQGNSDDSRSNSGATQEILAGSGGGGPSATTGSLFNVGADDHLR